MHAPSNRGYAATHLVLHSERRKRTQVKYLDRIEHNGA